MAPTRPSRAAKIQAKNNISRVTKKSSSKCSKRKESSQLEEPTEPKTPSVRIDPFQRLPDTAIEIIISQLLTPMTETLRRVSRRWKYYSELLNSNVAIARRFPNAKLENFPSRNLANLHFRRLLHAQESIGTNLAQSSRTISHIVAWDIKGEYFAYGKSNGNIITECSSQCPFRERSEIVLKQIKGINDLGLDGLWLLADGDLLVKVYDKCVPSRGAMIRVIHQSGQKSWQHAISRADTAEPGGGETCLYQRSLVTGDHDIFYNIEEPVDNQGFGLARAGPRAYCRALVARSVATGEILMWEDILETYDSAAGRLELLSVCTGTLLIVKDTARVIYVCSTSDLQPIRGMLDCRVNSWMNNSGYASETSPFVLQTEVFPSPKNTSWIERGIRTPPQGEQIVWLTKATWDLRTNSIHRCNMDEKYHSPGRSPGDNGWALQWAIDFDRACLCNFSLPDEDYKGCKRSEWDWSKGSLRMESFSIAKQSEGWCPLMLHRADRRKLELPAKEYDHYKTHQKIIFEDIDDPLAFLGFVEKTLVHFTPSSRRLTLVDFQVTW